MSIATVLSDVLLECGIDRISPDINEATFEMRQIKSLMNTAGKDIQRKANWHKAIVDETLAAGTDFPLPDDFLDMAGAGAVVLSDADHYPVRAVTSPELWQFLGKFPSEQTYYFVSNGNISFSPAIDGATMRYISANWLDTGSSITSGTDETVFPEHLLTRATVWRWKRQKGLPHADVQAEFEADLEKAILQDSGV